jgi:hypothetical protein
MPRMGKPNYLQLNNQNCFIGLFEHVVQIEQSRMSQVVNYVAFLSHSRLFSHAHRRQKLCRKCFATAFLDCPMNNTKIATLQIKKKYLFPPLSVRLRHSKKIITGQFLRIYRTSHKHCRSLHKHLAA